LLLCGLHSCWELQQALLANALTSHRAQLVRLLQEEGAAEHLMQLAAAARQLWQGDRQQQQGDRQQQQQQQQQSMGSHDSADAGAAHRQTAITAIPQVVEHLRPFARPRHRLQLLLLGWLLRLDLLLAAAAAAGAADGATPAMQAQLQEQLQRVDGAVILTVDDGQLLLPPQQQQEVQMQEQQLPATGIPERTPLRRGPSVPGSHGSKKEKQHPPGDVGQPCIEEHDIDSGSSSSQGSGSAEDLSENATPGANSRKKKKKSKHTKHAKHRKRHRSSTVKVKVKRHKSSRRHSKKRRRQSLTSSSRGSTSEDDECLNSEDLDAGGELLDLTGYPAQHNAGSKGLSRLTASAGDSRASEDAADVVALLESFSLGGRLWRSPQWQVRIPSTPARQQWQQQADKLCVAGNTAEVMDALSCYWVWDMMRSSQPG
jgi:hypothetical protein